jgi:ABC-type nitrate/sulfonate/bicarbonate transport system substrate-binding protein
MIGVGEESLPIRCFLRQHAQIAAEIKDLPMIHKRKLITLAASTLVGSLIGMNSSASQAQGGDPLGGATTFAKAKTPTDVAIILDWTPNTNHIGFYVAQEKGYFKEANLNVTIQPAGDVGVETLVAIGKDVQFGISYQEFATYAIAEGQPIVSVAAIIQRNTSGFASLKEKHALNSPADLIGLRYGGFGSAIEKPIIDALIACAGKEGSAEMLDIGFVEPLPLLERDQIDFVWLFQGWDGLRAGQEGFELSYVMLSDYPECVPNYYTPILITNQAMILEKPDVVAAFVQATARGYADAINDPKAAAEILLKAAPELDAKLVEASAEYLAKEFMGDAPRWGEQNLEVWENFGAFLTKAGALEKPFDAEAAFNNSFLPGKAY